MTAHRSNNSGPLAAPRVIVVAIIAAIITRAVPARGATIIDGFTLGSRCVVAGTFKQLSQLPGTCQANLACESTSSVGYDARQICDASAPQSFTLSGTGNYFVLTQWSGTSCSGTYSTAAAVLTNECVPLGFLGIPAYGLSTCSGVTDAEGSLSFFVDGACSRPFPSFGTFKAIRGHCDILNLGSATFALTAKCDYPLQGFPIPFAEATGGSVATTSTQSVTTTTPTQSTPLPSPPTSSSPPVGAIVGGVLGGLAALALLVVLLFWMRRRRRPAESIPAEKAEKQMPAGSPHMEPGTVRGFSSTARGNADSVPRVAASPSEASNPALAEDVASVPSNDPHQEQALPVTPAAAVALAFPLAASGDGASADTAGSTLAAGSVASGTPLFPGGSPIAPPPVPQPSSKLLVSATDIVIDSSQKLGEGSFGVVYVGTLRGTRVAVKTLKGDLDEHTLKAFAKEVTNWEGLVQRNVLPLMAYCPSPPMMVTDLVRDGNLRKYLSARGWPLDLGLRFLEDVANGMVYLHGLGILHGDIKSLNVLIDGSKAMITDFGLSRVRQEVGKSTAAGTVGGGLSGTPGFLAPELVDGAALQKPADVYAFSMLCYEVVSKGKYPLEELLNPALVLYNVAVKGVRPERPEGVPDAVWSLMERCWDQDPKKRPTFVQVAKELDEIVG